MLILIEMWFAFTISARVIYVMVSSSPAHPPNIIELPGFQQIDYVLCIHIYIYVCVCMCVCVFYYFSKLSFNSYNLRR
jgi:hypothetical protein